MKPFKEKTLSLLRILSNSRVFAFLLLWLMVILVAGTIAEKASGLYVAEQSYFSSAILWLWDLVPLPGLLTVAFFIFLGLVARLVLEEWRWKNLGTIIIHIGAALLLFGGFISTCVSSNGMMVIPHGESRNYVEDSRHVELVVAEINDGETGHEIRIPEERLEKGNIGDSHLPFKIALISWCRNCALVRLPATATEGDPHGVALNFVLKNIPRAAEDENNRAGLTFRLFNTKGSDGLYAIFQDMPIPEIVTVAGRPYLIAIRYRRSALPFSIRLDHFKEEL
ncbi:MAG: hypothetical protein JWM96_440, partial [Alphaproteobacteria bacterium]|nr:hypothetical protein [Alphaproteobacteria bacterium]